MFGPWLEVFTFFRGLVPSRISRPHFNYITLHCTRRVILGLTWVVLLNRSPRYLPYHDDYHRLRHTVWKEEHGLHRCVILRKRGSDAERTKYVRISMT